MRRTLLFVYICLLAAPAARAAFDGPRVYWPLPKNTNIVAGHYFFGIANAAWSNWNRIQPNVDVESQTYMLTFTRVQPLFGRTAFIQGMLPAGTLDTSTLLPDSSQDTFVNGLGDLTLAATINLFGTPSLKAKEYLRHDLNLSVNFGVSMTLPTGEYDATETLNIGSNQWKTRLSLPIVKSFSAWVPGRRTTLEVMPAVTVFGDNDDALGLRVEQDDLRSVEAHLTRDMTQQAFISLDYAWLEGGEETFMDTDSGSAVRTTTGLDTDLLGATLGFEINDHMNLFVTHMQTLSESKADVTLEGSLTKITLAWSWHDVLEKVKQFRRH